MSKTTPIHGDARTVLPGQPVRYHGAADGKPVTTRLLTTSEAELIKACIKVADGESFLDENEAKRLMAAIERVTRR